MATSRKSICEPPTEICAFCFLGTDREKDFGKMQISKKIWAHNKCLKYNSRLAQYLEDMGFGGFNIEEVVESYAQTKSHRCFTCKSYSKSKRICPRESGASAGCAIARCNKSFHFPCAPLFEKVQKPTIKGKTIDYFRVWCSQDHKDKDLAILHKTQYAEVSSSSEEESEEEEEEKDAPSKSTSAKGKLRTTAQRTPKQQPKAAKSPPQTSTRASLSPANQVKPTTNPPTGNEGATFTRPSTRKSLRTSTVTSGSDLIDLDDNCTKKKSNFMRSLKSSEDSSTGSPTASPQKRKLVKVTADDPTTSKVFVTEMGPIPTKFTLEVSKTPDKTLEVVLPTENHTPSLPVEASETTLTTVTCELPAEVPLETEASEQLIEKETTSIQTNESFLADKQKETTSIQTNESFLADKQKETTSIQTNESFLADPVENVIDDCDTDIFHDSLDEIVDVSSVDDDTEELEKSEELGKSAASADVAVEPVVSSTAIEDDSPADASTVTSGEAVEDPIMHSDDKAVESQEISSSIEFTLMGLLEESQPTQDSGLTKQNLETSVPETPSAASLESTLPNPSKPSLKETSANKENQGSPDSTEGLPIHSSEAIETGTGKENISDDNMPSANSSQSASKENLSKENVALLQSASRCSQDSNPTSSIQKKNSEKLILCLSTSSELVDKNAILTQASNLSVLDSLDPTLGQVDPRDVIFWPHCLPASLRLGDELLIYHLVEFMRQLAARVVDGYLTDVPNDVTDAETERVDTIVKNYIFFNIRNQQIEGYKMARQMEYGTMGEMEPGLLPLILKGYSDTLCKHVAVLKGNGFSIKHVLVPVKDVNKDANKDAIFILVDDVMDPSGEVTRRLTVTPFTWTPTSRLSDILDPQTTDTKFEMDLFLNFLYLSTSGYRINLKVVPNCDYFNDNEANPTATLLCRKLQRRVGDKKEGNKMTLLLPTPQQLVPDFKGFACQVFKDVVAQHVKEALRKKKLLSFFLAPSHFHGKLVLDPNDLLDLIAEMPSSHSFKCDILLAADPVRCLEMVSSVFLVQLTSDLGLHNQAEEGQNV